MKTNNVTRFLAAKKVPFELFESEPIKRSALESAALYGLDPAIVFKTIVARKDVSGKPLLCIVPSPAEVDAKKLAKALNVKKTWVVTQQEAEKATGYESGGISPLALIHRGFQMILHDSVQSAEIIAVSGGERGMTVLLKRQDLIQLLNPVIADIASFPAEAES